MTTPSRAERYIYLRDGKTRARAEQPVDGDVASDSVIVTVSVGAAAAGTGRVAVLARLSATRPDRATDGPQLVLVTLTAAASAASTSSVGDPAAVAAFWA